MDEPQIASPDGTAVYIALRRVLYMRSNAPSHVLEGIIGLKLLALEPDWRQWDDMDPQFTHPFRVSIATCAHFIEGLVIEQTGRGLLSQYVTLGARLDSSTQRRLSMTSCMTVFKVDQPGPQAWKRQHLQTLGLGIPRWLRFIPVDFEVRGSWQDALVTAGFDTRRPATVASADVSMYLSRGANAATLRQVASLAPGSILTMTFLLPLEMAGPDVRPGLKMAEKGTRTSGIPLISFFTPPEMLALAHENGSRDVQHTSADTLTERYFSGQTDGLRPPRNAEELLPVMVWVRKYLPLTQRP